MDRIMTDKKNKKENGFAILFSVALSAVLLAIALGVGNIAFREQKFSTSSRAGGEAFFAADSGIECALANDKSTSNSFKQSGGSGFISCDGRNINLTGAYPAWTFILTNLGSSGRSCAKVSLARRTLPLPETTIISKGYDTGDAICNSSNPNRVEREIKTTYLNTSTTPIDEDVERGEGGGDEEKGGEGGGETGGDTVIPE